MKKLLKLNKISCFILTEILSLLQIFNSNTDYAQLRIIKEKKEFKKNNEKIFNHIIEFNQHEMTLLLLLIMNVENNNT